MQMTMLTCLLFAHMAVSSGGMQIDTFPSSVGAPNGPKYFVMIATLSRVYQVCCLLKDDQ